MLIDAHAHIRWPGVKPPAGDVWEYDRKLIEAADILGIDILVCSCLAPRPSTPETFRIANDHMIAAAKEFKGRVWGYAYVNPGYTPEAIADIERCMEVEDMVGVKLYNEYKCTDPAVRPVIEKCVELDVPILYHQGHCTDSLPGQPNISDAGDLAALAKSYPTAKLIAGHIGGGGDWEWTIKAASQAPTLYADTSGSVVDEGMIEMAVKWMGADRLLFACDGSMCAGVGKLRGAQISKRDKEKIASANFLRLVGRKAT
ncbi:MAG: amidohydrolase family protein [Planctomycetota bacterium]